MPQITAFLNNATSDEDYAASSALFDAHDRWEKDLQIKDGDYIIKSQFPDPSSNFNDEEIPEDVYEESQILFRDINQLQLQIASNQVIDREAARELVRETLIKLYQAAAILPDGDGRIVKLRQQISIVESIQIKTKWQQFWNNLEQAAPVAVANTKKHLVADAKQGVAPVLLITSAAGIALATHLLFNHAGLTAGLALAPAVAYLVGRFILALHDEYQKVQPKVVKQEKVTDEALEMDVVEIPEMDTHGANSIKVT